MGSSTKIYLKTNELLSDTQNYIKYMLNFQIWPNSMIQIEHIYILYFLLKYFLRRGVGVKTPKLHMFQGICRPGNRQ